jgi:hypothetical protein
MKPAACRLARSIQVQPAVSGGRKRPLCSAHTDPALRGDAGALRGGLPAHVALRVLRALHEGGAALVKQEQALLRLAAVRLDSSRGAKQQEGCLQWLQCRQWRI